MNLKVLSDKLFFPGKGSCGLRAVFETKMALVLRKSAAGLLSLLAFVALMVK